MYTHSHSTNKNYQWCKRLLGGFDISRIPLGVKGWSPPLPIDKVIVANDDVYVCVREAMLMMRFVRTKNRKREIFADTTAQAKGSIDQGGRKGMVSSEERQLCVAGSSGHPACHWSSTRLVATMCVDWYVVDDNAHVCERMRKAAHIRRVGPESSPSTRQRNPH